MYSPTLSSTSLTAPQTPSASVCRFYSLFLLYMFFFFFFQAEDGIRDIGVTGVQTCALPISRHPGAADGGGAFRHRAVPARPAGLPGGVRLVLEQHGHAVGLTVVRHAGVRSEERRVGKECRSRWSPYH